MKGKISVIISVIVIVLVLAVVYYFLGNEAKAPEQVSNTTSGQVNVPREKSSAAPETTTSTPAPTPTPTPTTPPSSHFSDESDVQPPPSQPPPSQPAPSQPPAPKPTTVTITYNGTAFSPATITIKSGDTAAFKNSSSGSFWPASNPHPSHTAYLGFDAGNPVAAGGTYSFTFTKVGQWGYHNHMNPTQGGTVVVQ